MPNRGYGEEDLQNRNRSGLLKNSSQGDFGLPHGVDLCSIGKSGVIAPEASSPVQLVNDAMDRWQQDW